MGQAAGQLLLCRLLSWQTHGGCREKAADCGVGATSGQNASLHDWPAQLLLGPVG